MSVILAEINIHTDFNVCFKRTKKEEALCEVKLVTQMKTKHIGGNLVNIT